MICIYEPDSPVANGGKAPRGKVKGAETTLERQEMGGLCLLLGSPAWVWLAKTHAIHNPGNRANRPFVASLMRHAIRKTLIEASFWPREGALPRTVGQRQGFLEQAADAHLIFDEVGETASARR